MNVRLVLLLSLLGLVVGFGSVAGMIRSGVETLIWCGVAMICAIVLARQLTSRHFIHGFLTGFIAVLLGCAVQVAFFDRYLANNPRSAEAFQRIPTAVPPRVLVILLTPIVAGLLGLLTGFLAWAADKAFGRRPVAPV